MGAEITKEQNKILDMYLTSVLIYIVIQGILKGLFLLVSYVFEFKKEYVFASVRFELVIFAIYVLLMFLIRALSKKFHWSRKFDIIINAVSGVIYIFFTILVFLLDVIVIFAMTEPY